MSIDKSLQDNDIIMDIIDICRELTDENFDLNIEPAYPGTGFDPIRFKELPILIRLSTYPNIFNLSDVYDTILRIKDYLEIYNLDCEISLRCTNLEKLRQNYINFQHLKKHGFVDLRTQPIETFMSDRIMFNAINFTHYVEGGMDLQGDPILDGFVIKTQKRR